MLRPSWLLVAFSMPFATGCLLLSGLALSGFAHWDPCMWMAAIVVGGPVFALAYCQYAATFRGNRTSAQIISALMLLMGLGGLALPFALLLGPLEGEGLPSMAEFFSFATPCYLFGAAFLLGGFLNYRWYLQLAAAPIVATVVAEPAETPAPSAGRRVTLRELLAGMAALSVLLAGFTAGYRDIPPQTVLHGSPQEAWLDLPSGASDVCVSRGSRDSLMYDFAIDEAGFLEWSRAMPVPPGARDDGIKLRPIVGSFAIFSADDQIAEVEIRRGWYFDWRSGHDSGLHYAYDADHGRAYYFKHRH